MKIKLPMDIRWRHATLGEQFAKVTEEYFEVCTEIALLKKSRGSVTEAMDEVYDLIQAAAGLLKVLEREYGADIIWGEQMHTLKLESRGVVDKCEKDI